MPKKLPIGTEKFSRLKRQVVGFYTERLKV